MKAYIISDEEFKNDIYEALDRTVCGYLEEKGFEIEKTGIVKDDLSHCLGCFGCWVKKPGECVIGDGISEINRHIIHSDLVVYLSPVVFGQFSANIKNTIDRWLPHMLPFFITRPDGSSMHPPRYDYYPKQLMIGYGEDLSEEDAELFTDITKKHRSHIDVLIWRGSAPAINSELDQIKLEKVGGPL